MMGSDLRQSPQTQDDEMPVREVWVEAFECAIHPVTQAQYADFLTATSHEPPREWPANIIADDLPVTGVSWLDAQAFCAWRSALGDSMRLPSEAEWEYAARGGRVGELYPWGNDIPAWLPNGGRGPLAGPWPVTLGEPNGFGIVGISANIHEWCANWYSEGRRRASRGGAWRHAVTISRCAQRSKLDPSFRYTDYGFRTVREMPVFARQ